MARIPKLDPQGRFLAPDVNAQIDARAQAVIDAADLGSTETVVTTATLSVKEPGDFLAEVATVLTLPDASQVRLAAGEVAAIRYFAGAWRAFTASPGAVTRDETAPTAGTLAVAVAPTTATLTVTGALDDVALHALPYAYSKDAGATWTAWTDQNSWRYEGLSQQTSYSFRHKVRDAAGNEKLGTTVTKSTTKVPVFATAGLDSFTAPDGTSVAGRTTEVGGLTTTGTATITGNRVSQGQVATEVTAGYPAPSATTKNPTRASMAYSAGPYVGSSVRLGIWGNATGIAHNTFTINAAGQVGFIPYTVPAWTVAWEGGAAPTVATTGTMVLEVDTANGTGTCTVNGARVATITGPAGTHSASGVTATVSREGWVDDLKLEVAS